MFWSRPYFFFQMKIEYKNGCINRIKYLDLCSANFAAANQLNLRIFKRISRIYVRVIFVDNLEFDYTQCVNRGRRIIGSVAEAYASVYYWLPQGPRGWNFYIHLFFVKKNINIYVRYVWRIRIYLFFGLTASPFHGTYNR